MDSRFAFAGAHLVARRSSFVVQRREWRQGRLFVVLAEVVGRFDPQRATPGGPLMPRRLPSFGRSTPGWGSSHPAAATAATAAPGVDETWACRKIASTPRCDNAFEAASPLLPASVLSFLCCLSSLLSLGPRLHRAKCRINAFPLPSQHILPPPCLSTDPNSFLSASCDASARSFSPLPHSAPVVASAATSPPLAAAALNGGPPVGSSAVGLQTSGPPSSVAKISRIS